MKFKLLTKKLKIELQQKKLQKNLEKNENVLF